MHTCLGDRDHLVIISDRHLSIPNGVLSVFKDVEYYVCMQNVFKNLKKCFKDSLINRFYFSCAKSYTLVNFEFNMISKESIYSDIRSYLSNVGF